MEYFDWSELLKYAVGGVAFINTLIVYILRTTKKGLEKRLDDLESQSKRTHDNLLALTTEHNLRHGSNSHLSRAL